MGDERSVLAARFAETAAGQAELLVPMIESALREAGITPADLHAIAVTIGPGSFAGTRIGLAVARGMALVTGARLIGLTTFEAVAAAIPEGNPCVVAFDARKGQLYLQAFATNRTPMREPIAANVLEAAAALGEIPDGAWLVGSGAPALAAALGLEESVRPLLWPDAARFLPDVARHGTPSDTIPRPLYLRAPGAVAYRPMAAR